MNCQLLRHATTIIDFAGKKILIDPVLSPAGTRNPFPTKGSAKRLRNPLVNLPLAPNELTALVNSVDAILITHTHNDHFDDLKGAFLPKNIPIFCQPEDLNLLKKSGFTKMKPVNSSLEWEGIRINRTRCNHGGAFWRAILGTGSGYVLEASTETTLYITGDSIWCHWVADTIQKYHPKTIIIYSGAAQLPFGRSITMNKYDIQKVCEMSRESHKIIVHMEAINHCLLKRAELYRFLKATNHANNVYLPNDGEMLSF